MECVNISIAVTVYSSIKHFFWGSTEEITLKSTKHNPIEKKINVKVSHRANEVGNHWDFTFLWNNILYHHFYPFQAMHRSIWVRLRRRQNFPCDSAADILQLFPLQSCQTLSAVWKKMLKGVSLLSLKVLTKMLGFFLKASVWSVGFFDRQTQTFPLITLCGWPFPAPPNLDCPPSLCTTSLVHRRSRKASLFFLPPLSICLLLANGYWKTH